MDPAAQQYLIFETAYGFCGIAWNGTGVTGLQLPAKTGVASERSLLRKVPGAVPGTPGAGMREVIGAVKRYFAGGVVDFADVRLDLPELDDLFRQIYAAVRAVRWGQTTTYGGVAKGLGAGPEVARDVGQAMARNPIPLIIPCHRVLAAGNKVGGFSAPGGSTAKIRMLELEGVHVGPKSPAQQTLRL